MTEIHLFVQEGCRPCMYAETQLKKVDGWENVVKITNAKQNGVCAICKRPEKTIDRKQNKFRRLAVDHCHNTDKIRGLLCFECNTGIGKFKDNPQLIERAAEYIRNEGELN